MKKIKIIQAGDVQSKVVRFTCRYCHCVFEVKKDYCRRVYKLLKEDEYYMVECPNCSEYVTKDVYGNEDSADTQSVRQSLEGNT